MDFADYNVEVMEMASYIAPAVKDKFETLSVDLKNYILSRDVKINNMFDLIAELNKIVEEEE